MDTKSAIPKTGGRSFFIEAESFFPALPILGPGLFETDSEIFDAVRN